jgi:hypothetical protein
MREPDFYVGEARIPVYVDDRVPPWFNGGAFYVPEGMDAELLEKFLDSLAEAA